MVGVIGLSCVFVTGGGLLFLRTRFETWLGLGLGLNRCMGVLRMRDLMVTSLSVWEVTDGVSTSLWLSESSSTQKVDIIVF